MVESDITPSHVLGNTVSPQAYVYVIAAGDEAVKIGVAKNVRLRLKGLQTGHSKKLTIAYEFPFAGRDQAYAIECRAHKLLKARLMEGEWFSVSPEEAKAVVEKAIADHEQERLRKKEELAKLRGYTPPTIIQAEPWMRDAIDAVSFLARQEGELKKEYLVDFGDTMISVACGKDRKTGERTFMTNDVTPWYIRGEDAAA
jgi:predicted GIY-YIG superfamily endonuclease